ncbi:E3 ubiquitin-protein ligase RSL1-like [Ziziphus jujuba]|uniref:RBR-type E3 ubiquitin transferase n=1 Tax=Ziziphus jujuba TaxID=326968 RepID=A0ABM3I3E8_ZIZJJ|nr:E3 ubiquitin-protein ligase RSL1-like [Ziziphus jujuba]XP_048319828.1 E3 ubiquitin-protein ligase RSL1-like [Ziziphus jujuba]
MDGKFPISGPCNVLFNNHEDCWITLFCFVFLIIIIRSFKRKKTSMRKETGQSSHNLCLICMDVKSSVEMFRNITCSHPFCNNCLGKYITTKIQQNISKVECPDLKCESVLEPHLCRSIVPKEVFDRWEDALCEALFLDAQKFYCPFKDCSVLLVNDGEEAVTMSECPNCHRLFCAQCKVAWHDGMKCNKFQKIVKEGRGREDMMAMLLAKKKQWRRCPSCKMYVEKISGCIHITCRCRYEFCYACGSKWSSTHACNPARVGH